MPQARNVTAVSAAAPVANAIAGSIYERPTFKALVRYYITGDAAGAVRVQINHGTRTILEVSPISRANRQPVIPDDFLLQAIVLPYEQIVIRLTDTAAGPDNVFWVADLTPIR